VFNSLFGWTNSATYGTVIGYNLYWLTIVIGFLAMGYNERKGHLPFMKGKSSQGEGEVNNGSDDRSGDSSTVHQQVETVQKV
jgi:high-affinity iron transporter